MPARSWTNRRNLAACCGTGLTARFCRWLFWIVILLLWPLSGFALLITGFWLPALLTMQAIYPVLDKAFDLERQIKAIRDAELDSSSDSDN